MKTKQKPNAYLLRFFHYLSLLSPLIVIFVAIILCQPYWPRKELMPSSYSNGSILGPYSSNVLRGWSPKKVIPRNPSSWPGEHGEPFIVPEDEATVDAHFKVHQFNVLASDRIAFNRYIGDHRNPKCAIKVYPEKLPTTTVIIVFHNEAWSTLLRTVHSVIDTSPSELLKEIILVDDKSTKVCLKRQLDEYVSKLPVRTIVLRQGHRSGLVTARLLAVAQAKGDALVFLDSHCECNEGWLEPLLSRIVTDRSRIVSPIMDVIDDATFAHHQAVTNLWGTFDWKISFRWQHRPMSEHQSVDYDETAPFRTPTVAGGIFAIDRTLFNFLGKYDEQMRIWGAENLEISFRIWSCGGSLEMVPCSRVGHVFRDKSPYALLGRQDTVIQHNTARVAKVWLEEWQDFYFTLYPSAAETIEGEGVEERLALKKRLSCKPFSWYLTHVFPNHTLPKNSEPLGQIQHVKSLRCFNNLGTLGFTASPIQLTPCDWNQPGSRTMYTQTFLVTERGQIVYDVLCLQPKADESAVELHTCDANKENQRWKYSESSLRLMHLSTGKCLDAKDTQSYKMTISHCDEDSKTQQWILKNNFRWRPPTLAKPVAA